VKLDELQILLALCLAGAIIGVLLYAHRFYESIWATPPAADYPEWIDGMPELQAASGVHDRRRDARTRHIVDYIECQMSSDELDDYGAASIMDLLGVPMDVSLRVIAGRK
jgi:hypothetical protein